EGRRCLLQGGRDLLRHPVEWCVGALARVQDERVQLPGRDDQVRRPDGLPEGTGLLRNVRAEHRLQAGAGLSVVQFGRRVDHDGALLRSERGGRRVRGRWKDLYALAVAAGLLGLQVGCAQPKVESTQPPVAKTTAQKSSSSATSS